MGTTGTGREVVDLALQTDASSTSEALLELEAIHYFPDGTFEATMTFLSDAEVAAMGMALSHADDALRSGNPPVGAVLLDRARNQDWGAATSDKTEGTVSGGHAEVIAYRAAQPVVRDQLQECTLVTTSQPCSSCAPQFAEGKIGRVVYAAARREIWDATAGRVMRQRRYNMHHFLEDGDTDTIVVGGFQREAALGKFTTWANMQGIGNAPDIVDIPRLSLIEEMQISPRLAQELQVHTD